MSITKILLAGVAGTVLASGAAAAGEPMKLSATELDQVTAGLFDSFARGYASDVQGLTGSSNQEVFANGRETNLINGPTRFRASVAANSGGTSTGEVTGGVIEVPVLGPGIFEGQAVFGGMFGQSFVLTEYVLP